MAEWGGKRKGSGRPPKLATQIKKAEKLTRDLNTITKSGLQQVAREYEDLISIAIRYAKGEWDADGKPDATMLRFILNIGLNTLSIGDIKGADAATDILKGAMGRAKEQGITLEQHNYYGPDVPGSSSRSDGEAGGKPDAEPARTA